MTNHNDMAREGSVKGCDARPLFVGVIASPDDLRRATRMRRLPDLFELRLDALYHHLPQCEAALNKVPAPLIITARPPREGGLHKLSSRQRTSLLLQFLPPAAYVDVELRSAAELKSVLAAATLEGKKRIISFHDFTSTPSLKELVARADSAAMLGADIFKVATRTDTEEDLARLLDFAGREREGMFISAMGMGKLGRKARRQLLQAGSILNYAPLGISQVEGQLTLRAMRNVYLQRGSPRSP